MNTKTVRKDSLRSALEHLLALINDDCEFPDAAYRTSRRYGVKQAELEAAYDQL